MKGYVLVEVELAFRREARTRWVITNRHFVSSISPSEVSRGVTKRNATLKADVKSATPQ